MLSMFHSGTYLLIMGGGYLLFSLKIKIKRDLILIFVYWTNFFTKYVIIDEIFVVKNFINSDVDLAGMPVYLLEGHHFTASTYCFLYQQIRKLQLYLTGKFSSPGRPADQDSDPPKRCPAPGVLVRHPHGGAVGDHAPPQRAAKSHHCTPPLNGLGETLMIIIIYYVEFEI